jgi:phospholipase/carboxylesterase
LKLSRDRIIEIALVAVVLVLGGTILYREVMAPVEPLSHPIAAAIVQEPAETNAWPPRGSELGQVTSPSVAVSAISASERFDAGPDTSMIDAGPPLPEPPPDSPTFVVRQEERDGIYFLEVVIGDATLRDELPMLVVLHGRGGSAQIPGGPFLGLTHPVRVIVPQATERLGEGYEWLPVYVGEGLVDRLSSTLFAQASRVAALVRQLSEERPTTGRVIVSGFSQGGLLSITLALYHDDLIGEAFPLACWLPPPLVPTYRRADLAYPRIRSMHGTADTTIPFGPTRDLFTHLASLGFDVTLVPFEGVAHTISADENALFHVWLDAAVCRAVGDGDCEDAAEATARALLPIDVVTRTDDAAVDLDASDVSDAGPDAP